MGVVAAAEKALREAASKDGSCSLEAAIDAIVSRLGDPNAASREAALAALSRLASKGDARVLEHLVIHLQHHDKGVRHTALEALAKLARADKAVIKDLRTVLKQSKFALKQTVLTDLKLAAIHGKPGCSWEDFATCVLSAPTKTALALISSSAKRGRKPGEQFSSTGPTLLHRPGCLCAPEQLS